MSRAVMGCNEENEGRASAQVHLLPRDVGILLAEIEKEPVPEKLLELARELQQALTNGRKTASAE